MEVIEMQKKNAKQMQSLNIEILVDSDLAFSKLAACPSNVPHPKHPSVGLPTRIWNQYKFKIQVLDAMANLKCKMQMRNSKMRLDSKQIQ